MEPFLPVPQIGSSALGLGSSLFCPEELSSAFLLACGMNGTCLVLAMGSLRGPSWGGSKLVSSFWQGAHGPEEGCVLQGAGMAWDTAGAWDRGDSGSHPHSDMSCLSEPAQMKPMGDAGTEAPL